jgi:hypothetical protein
MPILFYRNILLQHKIVARAVFCQTSPEKQPPVAGELTLQVAEKIAHTHEHKWRHSDLVL